jgi:hypothetical protein
MAQPVKPEPKFFLVDELYERGLDFYARTWFSNVPANQICGEKSTNYLESGIAASRIAEALPNVKLIFILRNPVDRAYSNFRWSRQNGMETEPDFTRALLLESQRAADQPQALRYSRPYAYAARGFYAEMLAPYFHLFSRERILILRYEDIEADSQVVAENLHRFLQLPARPQDACNLGVINAATDEGASPLSSAVREALSERYREPNLRLMHMLGRAEPLW